MSTSGHEPDDTRPLPQHPAGSINTGPESGPNFVPHGHAQHSYGQQDSYSQDAYSQDSYGRRDGSPEQTWNDWSGADTQPQSAASADHTSAYPQATPSSQSSADAYVWHPVGSGQPGAQSPGVQSPGVQYGGPQSPTGTTAVAERGRHRSRGGVFVLAVALAALIGGGAGVGAYAYVSKDATASSPISISTTQAPQTPALDGTVEAAASKIEPSVVTIIVRSGSSGDIGSGVVLDKDGHILTNNHVVAADTQSQSGRGFGGSGSGTSGQQITVTFNNGKTAQATIVGTAPTEDLAVLKVDGVTDLTPANFAKSSALQVGQSVVAAGAPLGLSETITSGIVSSTARPVRSGNNNDAVYMAVQTDAAINPGNSGGPLVDLNGSVVGINSSIASTGSSSDGSQSGNIGIGFSIPSDIAVRVAGQLISGGQASDAAMGVTVSGTEDQSLGSTTAGVPLQSVTSDGAAAKAGLQAGDVVTKVNDFETTTSDGLIAATRYYAPGTQVKVTYSRDGNTQTVPVTLGTS